MSMIPAGFELSYNGFTFDPEYTHVTRMGISPVVARNMQATPYSEYAIGVRTHIVGNPTTSRVQNALRLLTQMGKVLAFKGRSVGDLNINTGAVSDVKFGPVPKVVDVQFYGPKAATFIDWQVIVHLPTCGDAVYQFAAAELSFTVEHRLRRSGRVDRVVSGELVIANNRSDPESRRVMDSPDLYRDSVASPVPFGFRREWQAWRVDDSRTRLSFGWTDIEFAEDVYPAGIAWADASHTTNSNNKGLVQYTSTIEAEYEVAAGYKPITAERAFSELVARRTAAARQNAGGRAQLVPLSFQARETGIYSDPKCSFSFSYMVAGTSLKDAVKHSGMWTPSPDQWNTWQNSVRNSTLNAYGFSKLKFEAGDDRIVDLCRPSLESPGVTGGRLGGLLQGVVPQYPNPESSWILYENAVRVEVDSGVAVFTEAGVDPPGNNGIAGGELHSTVGPPTGTPTAGEIPLFNGIPGAILAALGQAGLSPAMQSGNDFGAISGTLEAETTVQHRSAATVYVFMTGKALRVGFPIPCPELTDVEGVVPKKDNRLDMGEGFVSMIVGNAAVPVFGAKWNLRYVLPRMPARPITPPRNPLLEGN